MATESLAKMGGQGQVHSRIVFTDCGAWLAAAGKFGKAQNGTSCPLPFSKVCAPFLPVGGALAVLLEALLFLAEILLILNENHDGGRGSGDGCKQTSKDWMVEWRTTSQKSLAE